MIPAHVIEITTPKKVILKGLWFGPKRPKRAVVWVHGLTGSAFSMNTLASLVADQETAVITFNNRGHNVVNLLREAGSDKSFKGGAAHEVFTECVDDIQGAINMLKRVGVKKIFLAGHSTGCQKSIYWAHKSRGGSGVRGIILLAPVSDYATAERKDKKKALTRALKVARLYIKTKRKHMLLPPHVWPETLDAQRFISLYTSDSVEEIFSYTQPARPPRMLQSVKSPLLILWAGKDEHNTVPTESILEWFAQVTRSQKADIGLVREATHGFKGQERAVATTIRRWIKSR